MSMCIQLMQEEIIGKIRWMAATIGMGDDKGDEELIKEPILRISFGRKVFG
jgi:hypothetical protein